MAITGNKNTKQDRLEGLPRNKKCLHQFTEKYWEN